MLPGKSVLLKYTEIPFRMKFKFQTKILISPDELNISQDLAFAGLQQI